MNKFLNTAFASWLKVFITTILSTYLIMLSNGHKLFSWDIGMVENLLTAGFVSSIPIIINALNPSDPRYGKGK